VLAMAAVPVMRPRPDRAGIAPSRESRMGEAGAAGPGPISGCPSPQPSPRRSPPVVANLLDRHVAAVRRQLAGLGVSPTLSRCVAFQQPMLALFAVVVGVWQSTLAPAFSSRGSFSFSKVIAGWRWPIAPGSYGFGLSLVGAATVPTIAIDGRRRSVRPSLRGSSAAAPAAGVVALGWDCQSWRAF
jgi:hypothetical protein